MSLQQVTRRMVVALDGSELATVALPYARALATSQSELILLRAVPEPIPMVELAGASRFPSQGIAARKRELAHDYLEAVASVLDDACRSITTVSPISDAPEAILTTLRERDASMAILASHGRGFLGRVVVGSVADRVIRASPMPVLVVHPASGYEAAAIDGIARIDRLVVPLDGSAMARQALPVAAELARHLNVPILLVRALPTRGEVAGHPLPDDPVAYEEMVHAAGDTLDIEASRLRADGLRVTTVAAIGAPARTILDEAGSHDIVVMTSHGHGGVRRWMLGSVAERLVRDGTTPVLLVPVAERAPLAAD